ncbi:MAG TPA: STAS domain-containing protein [Candidatus Polarisedimenticolaceae bacterium]|nr:STAS domain-containing protein [Candidatus Polarisedimenticolaceae bacterium]
MNLAVKQEGRFARLVLSGCDAIDHVNAAAVKAQALTLLADATDVAVDLSDIEFIDSAGVGVLVALFKNSRLKGGRARFCGLRPGVRSVLEIIRLDQIFEIYDDVQAAMRA